MTGVGGCFPLTLSQTHGSSAEPLVTLNMYLLSPGLEKYNELESLMPEKTKKPQVAKLRDRKEKREGQGLYRTGSELPYAKDRASRDQNGTQSNEAVQTFDQGWRT